MRIVSRYEPYKEQLMGYGGKLTLKQMFAELPPEIGGTLQGLRLYCKSREIPWAKQKLVSKYDKYRQQLEAYGGAATIREMVDALPPEVNASAPGVLAYCKSRGIAYEPCVWGRFTDAVIAPILADPMAHTVAEWHRIIGIGSLDGLASRIRLLGVRVKPAKPHRPVGKKYVQFESLCRANPNLRATQMWELCGCPGTYSGFYHWMQVADINYQRRACYEGRARTKSASDSCGVDNFHPVVNKSGPSGLDLYNQAFTPLQPEHEY